MRVESEMNKDHTFAPMIKANKLQRQSNASVVEISKQCDDDIVQLLMSKMNLALNAPSYDQF
jgi:hypothetical protein